MWFKAGSFAGLGTDAWLSNYALGVGTTELQQEQYLPLVQSNLAKMI